MLSRTIEIGITAPRRESFVDVTEELQRAIKDSGVTTGCAIAYCRHTTCGLLINEGEDGVLDDLLARLTALVPRDGYFAHDDFAIRTQNMHPDERSNGRAHVAQMIMGVTSHAVPVCAGEPMLGEWQRLILLELDEPKERLVMFHVFGQ